MATTSEHLGRVHYEYLLQQLDSSALLTLLDNEIKNDGMNRLKNDLMKHFMNKLHFTEQIQQINRINKILRERNTNTNNSNVFDNVVVMEPCSSFLDLPQVIIGEISLFLDSLPSLFALSFTCRYIFISIHATQMIPSYISTLQLFKQIEFQQNQINQSGEQDKKSAKIDTLWGIFSQTRGVTLIIDTFVENNVHKIISSMSQIESFSLVGPPKKTMAIILQQFPPQTVQALRLWVVNNRENVSQYNIISTALATFANNQCNTLKHYGGKLHVRITDKQSKYPKLYPNAIITNVTNLFMYSDPSLIRHILSKPRSHMGHKLFVSYLHIKDKTKGVLECKKQIQYGERKIIVKVLSKTYEVLVKFNDTIGVIINKIGLKGKVPTLYFDSIGLRLEWRFNEYNTYARDEGLNEIVNGSMLWFGSPSERMVSEFINGINTKATNSKTSWFELKDLYEKVIINCYEVANKKTVVGPIESSDNTPLPFICRNGKCGKCFLTKNELKEHVLSEHNGSDYCSLCGYTGQATHSHKLLSKK